MEAAPIARDVAPLGTSKSGDDLKEGSGTSAATFESNGSSVLIEILKFAKR